MESIWTADTKIRQREPLPENMEVPVAVIGAGLAGILTAYYLKQAGVRAVVLEADRIGDGQTKNTTAKITSQHGLVYDRLLRSFGHEMATHYAQANEAAIAEYERLIHEKEIDCDFVRCPAYLYSRTETKKLMEEVAAAKELGIRASLETDSELPFSIAGAAKFERQARFHPLKFLEGLAEEVEVCEHTKVLTVTGTRIETERGCVTAENIVFACHFPFINVPGYYFARMHQERSYVAALEGAKPLKGMYLGIDKDGLSFRPQGELLLLGGGSHRTGVNQRTIKKGCRYEILRRRAKELYPGCSETAHWSAQDCMTLDQIPYIGRFSRKNPGWYVATGFGKWGMTTAMASARILTAMICREECPQGDIFSPQRHFTAYGAKNLAIHGAYTLKGLAKHILPSGNKTLVPNCPHMGCRLEWNPDEASYDCPCHGSRFDSQGNLIDNPAQTHCKKRNH